MPDTSDLFSRHTTAAILVALVLARLIGGEATAE
jgi:hypothetical protein